MYVPFDKAGSVGREAAARHKDAVFQAVFRVSSLLLNIFESILPS
jgi:hypothetical protein